MSDWTRRDFIRTAAGTSIAATVLPSFASGWTNGGADIVRVGVIGCGGRGTGAAVNALEAAPSTRIVAMADCGELPRACRSSKSMAMRSICAARIS